MDEPLAAGRFSEWLTEMTRALQGVGESDVPCGGCTACCTSSQFILVEADETDTLARIPTELRFPAPRLPDGNVVVGYDERGHCPMLVDDECSIYEHRPRTCRVYDCRIFPAAGVEVTDDAQRAIGARARQWRFDFPTELDRRRADSVRAAATFIDEHPEELPGGVAPVNAAQRAVLAVRMHERFIESDRPRPG